MKYRYPIILGFFLGFLLGCFPLKPVANPLPIDPSKLSFLKDSIQKLDSLVKKTTISNPRLSIGYARKAMGYARSLKSNEELIHGYVLMGQAYHKSMIDSSYFYFNKALKLSDSTRNFNLKPIIFYFLGSISYDAKDFKRAINLFDSCIHQASIQKNYSIISWAYNGLGNLELDNKNQENAIIMYDSSYIIAKRHLIYDKMGVALGSIARFEKDPVKALKLEREAISYLKKKSGTEEGMARILLNIGYNAQNPDTALSYFKQALKLSGNHNLPEVEMLAYNNMVYCYIDKGNLQEAENCLVLHAIPLAKLTKNNDLFSTLSDSYADVLVKKGDFQAADTWRKNALRARVTADVTQASEQVRLLGVLLDLKSKEVTIQDKEKELLLQQNRLQKTRLVLIITVFLIIGFIFVILWLQQRNRVKLQVQQISSAKRIIEMEENEKGRTARELHDITGQLVMGITGEIENLDIPDNKIKEEIKGKIKDLGKSIRLISHRMNKAMLEHFTFEELITGQCDDIRKLTGLQIELEMPDEPLELNEEVVLHTYRIIQELLTNAGKYARESIVSVIFLKTPTELILTYGDNGPGFDASLIEKKGMGLMNIFERAKLLNGVAKVNSSPGKGTSWEIIIPLLQKKVKTV